MGIVTPHRNLWGWSFGMRRASAECQGFNLSLEKWPIFRCIFVSEKFCILIRISPKFIPMGAVDNNQALV